MRFIATATRWRWLAILVVATSIASAAAASARPAPVTLKLKGQYAERRAGACGKHQKFRLFRSRSVVQWRGIVTPHPRKHFRIRLQVKRCVRGHFRNFRNFHAVGKRRTGKYKGFFGAQPLAPDSNRRGAVVYYFARAVFKGHRSRRVFFAVTQ